MPAQPQKGTLKETQGSFDDVGSLSDVEVYVSWSAPIRPFKRFKREFYVSLISVCSVFGIILFLIEGIMPVILMIAVVFLVYVLSTIEPQMVTYYVSNLGIAIDDTLFGWGTMRHFRFGSRFGSEVLIVETNVVPGRAEFVIDVSQKEKIMQFALKHIPLHESAPTSLDRFTSWFSKRILRV